MKTKIKRLIRRIAQLTWVDLLLSRFVTMTSWARPDIFSRVSASMKACHLEVPLVLEKNVEHLLSQIPGETSKKERHFLFWFFKNIWNGRGDVVEIGPFLGSTTRAIAMGMDENPQCSPDSILLSIDKFENYYDEERLKKYVSPLLGDGTLSLRDLESLSDSVGFMDLFNRIHSYSPYVSLVVPLKKELPSAARDLHNSNRHLELSSNLTTSAVFIDGCKSWYATKYFMSQISRIADSGTFYIFQDYGWYTCFWIPVFLDVFREFFDIIGFADSTYTFRLTGRLNPELIHKFFPDTPHEFLEDRYDEIFGRLESGAVERDDFFGSLCLRLQHAGALAYIGQKKRARQIIDDLCDSPSARPFRDLISKARHSPTYTPEGPVLLDSDFDG